MRQASKTVIINAPLESTREILLAAPLLPEWNPAFVRVAGPAHANAGSEYELEVIRGMHGTLTYGQVQGRVITFSWRVAMLDEDCAWELRPQGPWRTAVTHTVGRHGALAVALAPTLRTLPGLRLDRLAERASTARTG